MIDGFKILVRNIPFQQWRSKVPVDFFATTDIQTGEIIAVTPENNPGRKTYEYKGTFQNYWLTVKEIHRDETIAATVTYHLYIRGSFHCNHFKGSNIERFKASALQAEISAFCRMLHLDPRNCELQNLEIGVNINPPVPIEEFISNCILLHSTSELRYYRPDRSGKVLGKFVTHTQCEIKCYSKTLQYSLEYPLMRFEVRCTKMQYLKKHKIRTLADLACITVLKRLSSVPLAAWDNILVCDPNVNVHDLPIVSSHRILLSKGKDSRFWIELHRRNKRVFNKRRALFRQLTTKYGTDYHSLIKGRIEGELIAIFDDSTVESSLLSNTPKESGNILSIKINSNSIPNEINRLSPVKPIIPVRPFRCLSAFNLSDRSEDQPIKQTSSSAPDYLSMVTSVVPVKAISDSSTYTNQGCQEQNPTAANYEEQLTSYSVTDYCCSTDRLVIPVDWLNNRFLRRQ